MFIIEFDFNFDFNSDDFFRAPAYKKLVVVVVVIVVASITSESSISVD